MEAEFNPNNLDVQLGEVEEILRTMPDNLYNSTKDVLSWFGRASAAMKRWDSLKAAEFNLAAQFMHTPNSPMYASSDSTVIMLLNEAAYDLRMRSQGASNIMVPQGGVFQYFEVIKTKIEMANTEIFFVDPYMESDFVSSYLPHVKLNVLIRLLTSDQKMSALTSSLKMFKRETPRKIEVRSSKNLHDRFLFVDKNAGYFSGASFKDGAKNAPALIYQVTDVLSPVLNAYEQIWNEAIVIPIEN